MQDSIARLFPMFEPAFVQELEAASEVRSFAAGEYLMKTGQNIRWTMLMIDGLVKIFREDDEGNEFFMYYLQPGQACAVSLMCTARHEQSQVMAKADKDSRVLMFPIKYLEDWMTRYRSWADFVLLTYRNRFEELLITIDHVAFRNMDERLVFYLKKHQQTVKTNSITTSFTEIAAELNSSREVISRLMKKLSDKGMVRLMKSHVEIVNLDKALL